MGEMTIMERIREWLGTQCYVLFLWFRGWSEEHYLKLIRYDALNSLPHDALVGEALGESCWGKNERIVQK